MQLHYEGYSQGFPGVYWWNGFLEYLGEGLEVLEEVPTTEVSQQRVNSWICVVQRLLEKDAAQYPVQSRDCSR